MSIEELIEKVIISEETRTNEERHELLVQAHVLDKDGYYDANFFSEDTVEDSKLALTNR